jgi:hypothetical protein
MSISQVKPHTEEFFWSAKLPLKQETFQVIKNTINAYTRGGILGVIYKIVNAVKAVFGRSDWQKVQLAVEKDLFDHLCLQSRGTSWEVKADPENGEALIRKKLFATHVNSYVRDFFKMAHFLQKQESFIELAIYKPFSSMITSWSIAYIKPQRRRSNSVV